MSKLTTADLMSLEQYARERQAFRARIMEHKKSRRLSLGANATLYFEDALTMQYQVQEMLRIERIFEQEGIQEELDVYNPMIPDGSNWKATFMIEYDDPEVRKLELSKLIGIDKAVWLQVEGFDKVRPISNEDLERETEDKTSAVHFMRIELSPQMAAAARAGTPLHAGIDHPHYQVALLIPEPIRQSLANDLA